MTNSWILSLLISLQHTTMILFHWPPSHLLTVRLYEVTYDSQNSSWITASFHKFPSECSTYFNRLSRNREARFCAPPSCWYEGSAHKQLLEPVLQVVLRFASLRNHTNLNCLSCRVMHLSPPLRSHGRYINVGRARRWFQVNDCQSWSPCWKQQIRGEWRRQQLVWVTEGRSPLRWLSEFNATRCCCALFTEQRDFYQVIL